MTYSIFFDESGISNLSNDHMSLSIFFLVLLSGTINPGVTQKLDNPLKGIRNTIPRNPDNPIKRIRNLVPNGIQSQWPRGLTVPT